MSAPSNGGRVLRIGRQEIDHPRIKRDVQALRLLFQNGNTCLNVRGWSSAVMPTSNRDKAMLQLFDSLAGRSLEDDLLVTVMQGVEGMKNSSCERSLPARNWMSSIIRISA
jgi:hypothetical protein